MPLIASYTGTRALRTDDYPLYFTTQANYFDETTRIIRHLTTVATGRVALMYQDDAFGKSMLPMVQKAAAAADAAATVLLAQPMDASGKNAAEAAQAVGEVKPQSVVLLVAGPGVVPAIRALRRSVSAPIYTYSLAISAAAVEALMLSAWPWCVSTPYPWSASQTLAKAFSAAASKQKLPIDYDHCLGYINGRVLSEAVRAAGANPTPATLAAALEKLGKLDLGGYALQYGPGRHHGSSFTEITILGPKGRYIR